MVTVSIISYFMPKEGKFNYEFELDTPWKYGLLQASFEFPIFKSEQQVQKERDSLLAQYQPYFTMDKNVEKNMFRVIIDSYDTKVQAAQAREAFKAKYPSRADFQGAWILLNK